VTGPPGRPAPPWPRCGGHGVGSALLRELVAAAEQRGYARLVVRPAAEARSLHARAGFSVADGSAGELLLVRSGTR